jgi:restriction endonuclease S subunit
LSTLTENDKKQYELNKYIDEKSISNSKIIECFFVERANQFLRTNGLLGIVLPSSILTNGKIYTKTRELIFANYNILGIVYLNSRTFGSTGTNTIILFAQRVKKNSGGLLNTFIEKKDYKQYLSWESIDKYIKKQGYDEFDYFAFMQDDELNQTLENNSVFEDYKKHFKKKPIKRTMQIEWFESSPYFKSEDKITKQKYKELFIDFLQSNMYKKLEEEEYRRQFIAFAKTIECNKLNTFIQIDSNNVAILQSPPDKINNKSNKAEVIKFLGYDWSNRKGDEGIKYITSKPIADNEVQEDTDDKDEEIVNAINSINYIDTPLYNPNDDLDNTKFAFAIRKHINSQCKKFSFGENSIMVGEFNGAMNELISYVNLSDMIDFSRAEFDKAIKPTIDKKVVVHSKFPLITFSSIVNTIETGSRPSGGVGLISSGILSLGGEHIDNTSGYLNLSSPKYVPAEFYEKAIHGKLQKNDILICKDGALTGKVALVRNELEGKNAMINEHIFIIRCEKTTTQLYLFEFLYSAIGQSLLKSNITGSAQGGLNSSNLKNIQIPLPPLDIQQQIVSECEKVDEEYKISQTTIETHNKQIVEHLNGVHGKIMSIGEIGKICMCKRIMKDETNTTSGIPFFKIGTFGGTPDAYISKEQFDKYKSTYSYPKKGQILISAAGTLGKSIIFDGKPSYFQDSNIVWIDNDESQILNLYLHKILQVVDWNKYKTEGSVIPRIYNDKLRSVTIPVPPLPEQQRIVSQIEQYEAQIAEAKAIMSGCAERKKKILEKYLN